MHKGQAIVGAMLRIALIGTDEGLALDALDRCVEMSKTDKDKDFWRRKTREAEAALLEAVSKQAPVFTASQAEDQKNNPMSWSGLALEETE